jgi:protein TonB
MSSPLAGKLAAAAALAALLAGAPSMANTPAPAAPEWVSKPTASVIEHYYPVRAKLDSRNGKASMRCGVTAEGTLEDCRVLSETPKPYGFGDSLLSMAQFFRMKPHDANGNPVAGMDVTVQLSFYIK